MLKRLALCLVLATPVWAVQPDEILPDAGLEARARALGQELRCPVCQGENIDESNAGVARDLRLLVRERLVAGDSDADVLSYVTDRYGEYVLFRPEARGANLILYWAGPAALLLALGGVAVWMRRRRTESTPAPSLSDAESARIKELLGEE